jgi:predicted dehydrogenase
MNPLEAGALKPGARPRTLALIGLGNVAEPHLLAYQTLPDVKVIAAVEPRAERRLDVCARYALRGFATTEAMLEECRPDIACILTPAATHRTLTQLCAAAGSHIMCEKPMAITLEDAFAMAQSCASANVQFFYGS